MIAAPPRRNIELKAHCREPQRTLQLVRELPAQEVGLLVQTDTYFRAPYGRLKLREIEPAAAELIWYDRPNDPATRRSEYRLVPVTDARAMIDALDAAMGIRGVVRKRRRLFMWHNVRIHLDEVHDLGHFIEFEAVIGGDDDEPASNARLAQLVHTLAIRDEDRIATSYSDLLRL